MVHNDVYYISKHSPSSTLMLYNPFTHYYIIHFLNSDSNAGPNPAQSTGKCYHYLMFSARELLYALSCLGYSQRSSGTNTTQYRAVLNSLQDIITAIKATPDMKETLSVKFMMEQWIQPTAACSEADLAKCALEKVRQDPEQFSILVDMFYNVAGMGIIAKKLVQEQIT